MNVKSFDVQLYLDQLNMEVIKEEKQQIFEANQPKKFIGSGEDVDLDLLENFQ